MDHNQTYLRSYGTGHPNAWYTMFTFASSPYAQSNQTMKILECPVAYSLYPGGKAEFGGVFHRNISMNHHLFGKKQTVVEKPSEFILIGDGRNSNPGGNNYYYHHIGLGKRPLIGDYIHNNKNHIGFCDGSVRARTFAQNESRARIWHPNFQ